MKDQIYFMQTETPTYDANKKAREAASSVSLFLFYFRVFYELYHCALPPNYK